MATLLRNNPDEYPQAYMQAASLLHVWNTVTLEWDKWDGVPSGTMTVSGAVSIDQTTPGTTNAVVVVDATGAELDFRQESENWNAADHGILFFGRDIQSTPNKYRAVRMTTAGDILTANAASGTATETQVADNAASTTILAANSARLGASIQNDSSAALYLRFGTGAASTTDYTVRLVQYAYFEVPYGYTGKIMGIWAADPNDGAARVTELT